MLETVIESVNITDFVESAATAKKLLTEFLLPEVVGCQYFSYN